MNISNATKTAHSRLKDSIFIHIRGGDYKDTQNAYLNVGLHTYYKSAVDYVVSRGVKHAYIFTNDRAYAGAFSALQSIPHTYVEPSVNEIECLYLMSRCAKGGIIGNSTFGWWGLYLNLDRPFLIMPDRWIVESLRPPGYAPNFIFPEAKLFPVS